MDIFRSRYFFITCIISMTFSVISFFFLPSVKLIVAMISVVATMIAMLIYIYKRSLKGKVILAIMFCMAIFLASFSSFVAFDAGFMAQRDIIGDEVEIRALVLSEEYNSGNMSGYSIRVEEVNGDNKSYYAILDCKYISDIHPGDRISATVTACDFEDNIHGYSEKKSRLSDGYYLSFESASEEFYEIIVEDVFTPRIAAQNLNFRLSYKLRDVIGGEEGNLSAAMFLGGKHYLSDTTIRDFSRSGASHFLALSGMHMAIIMGALSLVLRLLRVPKVGRAVFLIVTSIFYLILTGMSVSATRSVIMLLWVYLSMIFSYRSDSLTNLSFAGAIILIFSPFAVLDMAFWLSFCATFGIIVFMQIFGEIFDKIDCQSKVIRYIKKAAVWVIGLFATTVCAFVGLVLVICIFTKEYSFYTMLSSVALSLPSSCIILFSMLLPFFSFCAPIRAFLIQGIRMSGAFALDFCSDISLKENVVYSINYDFLIYFAIAFAIVFFVTLAIKLKRKYLVFFMYAPIIIGFIFTVNVVNANNVDKVDITYLNTSSNSDVIVISNDRTSIICDMSNGSSKAFYSALEIVHKNHATEIEAIMLTDYHTLHIPTLSKLFKSNIVRQLWLPTPIDEDSYYKMLSLLDVAADNNVKTRMYDLGDAVYAFSDVKITLNQDFIERSTVPVTLLSIECNDEKLTYFSPAFSECEKSADFEKIIASSDYLIAGARGPKVKDYYSIGEDALVRELVIPYSLTGIYLDTNLLPEDMQIYIGTEYKNYFFYRNIVN